MTREDLKHYCVEFLDTLPDTLEVDWRDLQVYLSDTFEQWSSDQRDVVTDRLEELQDILDYEKDSDAEAEWTRLSDTERVLNNIAP